MTDIRQCWAYNQQGQRCDHPAGHPGNHVIMQEWTDDECATPGSTVVATVSTASLREALAAPAPPIPAPPADDKCIACNHKHKGSACSCGCYEFIG